MALAAGFGTAIITPPTPVQLAGFIDDQPATEVHDDLEVRALFLRGEHGAVCLLVCDLLGMSRGFANPVRDAVGAALGLARGAVLTSCIHTHAGPSTIAGGHLLGWVTPDGYRETLVDRCVAAARAAAVAASPATLRAGRWPLPAGLSINRRGLPYDPTFAVVDVLAAADGTRIGTVANVSIHPVALGPECLAVSSDWVGSFRNELERRAGGTAVLLSGAIGDVNPCHVHRQDNDCGGDGFAEAEQLGHDVAATVDGALGTTEAVAADGPTVARERVVDVTLGSTLLTAGRESRVVPIELVEWTIGPVRLVSVPGEAFHALGRAIEARAGDGTHVLLAGLAPEWHGYLPAPFRDGYEESTSYGREAVATIAEALTH